MTSNKIKTSLCSILENSDAEEITKFISKHKLEDEKVFTEFITSLQADDLNVVWDLIYDVLEKCFKFISGCKEESINATDESASNLLSTFIQFASVSIDILTEVPLSIVQIIMFCSEMLQLLPAEKDALKVEITALCEKCWIKDISIKNDVIVYPIIYLLEKSISVISNKLAKIYLKRVYVLKDALKLVVQKTDVNQKKFLELLINCIESSIFHTLCEGRNLLAHIFCLNVSFLDQFHASIKKVLTTATLKESRLLGEIYFSAWLESNKEGKETLQEELEWKIQDIMEHAIYIPRHRGILLPKLRKFLYAFHTKRDNKGVLKLLCKLYSPILWRALEHHLGYVRANATYILVDVFPLEDPDLRVVESEAEVCRQALILKSLLTDDSPLVRSIAVVGVCTILDIQWKLINFDIITSYLAILAEDLAQDMSMVSVRLSVIKGMEKLIGSTFPIQILKPVLNKISILYYDPSEKVRIAFCNFLLHVKKQVSVKYWDIIPVSDLLDGMAYDKPPIQKLIVKLMYNSYIPVEQPEVNWLVRCAELITQNPAAAQMFFLYVTEFIGLKPAMTFITGACRALRMYVRHKSRIIESSKHKYRRAPSQNENDERVIIRLLDGGGDFKILSGISDAAYFLFRSILPLLEKPKNKKIYKNLLVKISKRMSQQILEYFSKEKSVWIPLYALCAYIPSTLFPEFSDMCYVKLTSLPEDAEPGEYKTLLECLCNFGKGFELLKHIQLNFQTGLQSTQKRCKIRASSVKTSDNYIDPSQAALYLLTSITYRSTRVILLGQNLDRVKEFLNYMEPLQKTIEESRTSLNDNSQKLFLERSFFALIKIAILMFRPNKHTENVLDTHLYLDEVMKWLSCTYLPKVVSPISERRSLEKRPASPSETELWKELRLNICNQFLNELYAVVTAQVLDAPAKNYVSFVIQAMESEIGPHLMNNCINVIFGLSQYCKLLSTPDHLKTDNHILVIDAIPVIIKVLQNETFYSSLPLKGKEIVKSFRLLLLSLCTSVTEPTDSIMKIMLVLLNSLIELTPKINENLRNIDLHDIHFPTSSIAFMSVISGHPVLLNFFLRAIVSSIEHPEYEHIFAASAIFSKTLNEHKSNAKKVSGVSKEVLNKLTEKLVKADISFDIENYVSDCLN